MNRIQPLQNHTPRDCLESRHQGLIAALLGVCTGVLCVSGALGNELDDWRRAKEAATCAAYQRFVESYPDGRLTPLARDQVSHHCISADGQADTRSALRKALDRVNEIPIEERQQALKALGHYTGNIDGKVGPKTERAIRAFQEQHGYAVNGQFYDEQLAPLFRQAAAAGDLISQRRLGIMAAKGICMLPDHVVACKWLAIAADRGDPDAKDLLAELNHGQRCSPSDAQGFFEGSKVRGDNSADTSLQSQSAPRRTAPRVMDALF